MHRLWHLGYLSAIGALVLVLIGFVVVERPTATAPDNHLPFQEALIRKTNNFNTVTWLGQPMWQSVLDVWTLQETIAELKPELIIECGTYKGGSALFYASLFDLLDTNGRVVTVDIEKLHDVAHPRITFLIGDCASPPIVEQIRAMRDTVTGPVMVVLDSDHSAAHVRKELDAYASFVTPGSFLHVQDGVIDVQPYFQHARPGPLRAIESFLQEHPEFTVDTTRTERFLITHHPKGWLRRANR